MTYEDAEVREIRKSHKIEIINANGEIYPATRLVDINICSNLTLNKVLSVPSLHKASVI
jgi:hypothetical protein